jgi:hypothetical protein
LREAQLYQSGKRFSPRTSRLAQGPPRLRAPGSMSQSYVYNAKSVNNVLDGVAPGNSSSQELIAKSSSGNVVRDNKTDRMAQTDKGPRKDRGR